MARRKLRARGGNATVTGDDSVARGGDAGEGVEAPGGDGGDAVVVGDRSYGIGGKGGRGGVFPGMPGAPVEVTGDSMGAIGGQGGESQQADGRGGRGGRAGGDGQVFAEWGVPVRRAHMKWPYWEPVTEPGRGGDGQDTIQHMARRLIVESIKRQQLAAQGLPVTDAWWDRDTVPIDSINEKVREQGHAWQVAIVDDEYEFKS